MSSSTNSALLKIVKHNISILKELTHQPKVNRVEPQEVK